MECLVNLSIDRLIDGMQIKQTVFCGLHHDGKRRIRLIWHSSVFQTLSMAMGLFAPAIALNQGKMTLWWEHCC